MLDNVRVCISIHHDYVLHQRHDLDTVVIFAVVPDEALPDIREAMHCNSGVSAAIGHAREQIVESNTEPKISGDKGYFRPQ